MRFGRPQESIQVDVTGCVRCGGNHERMLLTPLANPEDGQHYFFFCPEVTQPVMVGSEVKNGTRPQQG